MARPHKIPHKKQHERPWGAGSVKIVRPGVWRAWRARAKNLSGGKPIRPSRTFTGPEAEQRAALWARGDVEPDVLLLGHWLDRWLDLRWPVLRPATRRNYRTHINVCASVAARPLAEITSDELQVVANDLLGRRAWNTVNNWRSIISSALQAAIPRHLPHNPMKAVKLPTPIDQPPKAWRADEVEQLVSAAAGRKHEAWLWFALGTGARLGELRALLWTDIDVPSRTVTISKSIDAITNVEGPTKSGKTRIVDLPDEVMAVLVPHRARQAAGERRVFGSRQTGGPLLARTLEGWLSSLQVGINVRPLPVHSLRHAFATLSLEAGVPLKEVSESLGHANIAITARTYSHAVEVRRRRAADAMGTILAGARSIRRIGTADDTRTAG